MVAPRLMDLLEAHAPEVGVAIDGIHSSMWGAMDGELLGLCRLRMAMLHGDASEAARAIPGIAAVPAAKRDALAGWPDSPHFSQADRACLAFTELFVADVSAITQADVDAVLAELGPAKTYGFVQSLLFLDQHQRLALATERLLGPMEVTV